MSSGNPSVDEVRERLVGGKSLNLCDLPKGEKGVYLLRSHQCTPLYIGITDKKGFHKRLHGDHVRGTGKDGNSHKFGWGYNVGPFYLHEFYGKNGFSIDRFTVSGAEKTLVREYRARFVRRHCTASVVPILPPAHLPAGKSFKSYLEDEYERPIKNGLKLPWQDKQAAGIIAFDEDLGLSMWAFLDEKNLTGDEIEVFSKMEAIYHLVSAAKPVTGEARP